MAISKIGLQRLYHQGVSRQRFQTPAEIVAGLAAIQGQDYPGAKWSIGLRLPGSTDAQIEQAIANKKIIRTWVMRGTLHLVAAEDVRWLVALIAPRTVSGRNARYRELELDEQTLTRSTTLVAKALENGEQLTRKALFAVLEANGISTQGQRGIHMLQKASLEGLVCQGVERQREATFMALDDSIAQGKNMTREEALAELARRYFTSRGPATLQDFATWSSLAMADARAGLESVKGELAQETIDGQTYWLSPATHQKPDPSPTSYALPGFDEYILGYKERAAVLDPQHAEKICPGRNGVFYPTIIIDGRVVGVWKRTFKKGAVIITTEPFDGLSAAEKNAFAQAAARYGEFLQMPVVMA